MSSTASGDAEVRILERGVGEKEGKRRFIAPASLRPSGHVACVGVPITEQILWISSASLDPAGGGSNFEPTEVEGRAGGGG